MDEEPEKTLLLFISTFPGMSLKVGMAYLQGHCVEEGQQGWQSIPELVKNFKTHLLTGVVFMLHRKRTKPGILCTVTKIFRYKSDLIMLIF